MVAHGGGRDDRGSDGEISTVNISNFPDDASWRELKNFCRFLDGFQAAHVTQSARSGKQTLFVKFSTPKAASHALQDLNGINFDQDTDDAFLIRAEMAHRDLEIRGMAGGFGGGGPPRLDREYEALQRRKRELSAPRYDERKRRPVRTPSPARRADYREDDFRGERDRRGDRDRGPPRKVARFPDGELREEEPDDAFLSRADSQRDLDSRGLGGRGGGGGGAAPPPRSERDYEALQRRRREPSGPRYDERKRRPGRSQSPSRRADYREEDFRGERDRRADRDRGPPRKVARHPDGEPREEEADTLIWKIQNGDPTEEVLRRFQSYPGFVAFRVNDRINSAFVKYGDYEYADAALQRASKNGFQVEFARRNLNVD